MNVLYEVHIFRDQTWKIDSVYDDQALAIHEAKKIHRTGRFLAVRVMEEAFDMKTDRRTFRPVYVTNKLHPRSPAKARVLTDDADDRCRTYSAMRMKKKTKGLATSIILRLLFSALILSCGIGFLLWVEKYLNNYLT